MEEIIQGVGDLLVESITISRIVSILKTILAEYLFVSL